MLLSAVLVAGMVSNAAPATVFAQEETKPEESVQVMTVEQEADTMSFTLNITIEGYEGNDPAVLGAITLKRLYPTEEEWESIPSMTGNVITCTVVVPNTGTYQWNLGGTPYGYQTVASGHEALSFNQTFYSVYFKNGSDTYATKYVSKTNFLNFSNKVIAPQAPTREGYTFAGWVTEEDGSDAFDFNSAITGVTTVYASWTEAVEPPVITKQPDKNLSCPTFTYTRLTIAASGDNPTYQWQVNRNDDAGFVNIAGEKSDTITIAYPKESQDGHLYRCVVTNAGGSVASEERELAVSDVRVRKAKQVVQEAVEEITVTNDTDKESILNIADAALRNAGITKVDVTVFEFSKTEATEDGPGNISAEIEIECGVSSEYVGFSCDIARLSHTCSLSLVSKAEPDCTTAGKQAYYHCAGCGKGYADAEGTTLIADLASWGNISALGHDYAREWDSDEENHWHVCSRCSAETDVNAHTEDGGTVTKEPTETETGIRTYCCSVCGKERTETIPATETEPGTGNATPGIEQGTGTPATNISTPAAELEDMLLTEDEKQQAQNGTNIRIVLEVKDAGNTVSDEDKENIRQALNGFAVGQYLNIDLYKLVGTNRTDITETAKKIRIVITVPDSLKNADSNVTRTFAVIRVHDGRAELLTDLDDSADTITIETDRFSTYAIVYKDSSNGGNGGNNGTKPVSPKDDEPKTGDAATIELYATLTMIAGFAYLLLYFTDQKRGMTEKTKKEVVSRLVRWAKQGGRIRKYLALAAIFVLLVYYHSIGKKTCVEWKEIYGE